MIEDITRDIAEGEVYVGKVIDIKPIGAIVELAPGRDGMIHISQLAHERVGRVEDVVNIGDEVVVKVIERDPSGKSASAARAMLPAPEPGEAGSEPRPARPPSHDGGGYRGGDRGGRGGDRGGRGGHSGGGDRGPSSGGERPPSSGGDRGPGGGERSDRP